MNILGLLTGEIVFNDGLDITSDENGTFKTKLLQEVKRNALNARAFSPKRNAERRNFQSIVQSFKSQNIVFSK